MCLSSSFCYLSTMILLSHTLIQGRSVPLGIASQHGHYQVVELLLNAGAKINYRNKVMSMHLGILYSCIETKYVADTDTHVNHRSLTCETSYL